MVLTGADQKCSFLLEANGLERFLCADFERSDRTEGFHTPQVTDAFGVADLGAERRRAALPWCRIRLEARRVSHKRISRGCSQRVRSFLPAAPRRGSRNLFPTGTRLLRRLPQGYGYGLGYIPVTDDPQPLTSRCRL